MYPATGLDHSPHQTTSEPNPYKVDFVIPCLNAGQALEDSVNSILNQTAASHIGNIIIINDGSEDETTLNTLDALKSTTTCNVTIAHNAHPTGPGAARNQGVRHATGKYIAFLDADDILLPQSLELRLIALEKNPDGFVGTDFFIESHKKQRESEGFFFSRSTPKHVLSTAFDNEEATVYASACQMFLQSNLAHLCSCLLTKEMFVSSGGFREDLPWLEDYDFFLRLARSHPFIFVPTPTFIYRYNPESTTNTHQRWPPGYWGKILFRNLLADSTLAPYRQLIRKGIERRCRQNAYYWLKQGDHGKALTESYEAVRLRPGSYRSWRLFTSSFFTLATSFLLKRRTKSTHPPRHKL